MWCDFPTEVCEKPERSVNLRRLIICFAWIALPNLNTVALLSALSTIHKGSQHLC
jgi:hypothetical protein